jgi:hypothetical protein
MMNNFFPALGDNQQNLSAEEMAALQNQQY